LGVGVSAKGVFVGIDIIKNTRLPSDPKKKSVTQLTRRWPKDLLVRWNGETVCLKHAPTTTIDKLIQRSAYLWLNIDVTTVWTRPSSKSPTGEMVKCSVMKRVHLRELDAHVQAPKTWVDSGRGRVLDRI
jgi:hypothetical protein